MRPISILLAYSSILSSSQADPNLQHPLPQDDTFHGISPKPPPSYRHDLLNLHKTLCEVSSISGHEMNGAQTLAEYLDSQAWTYTLQRVPPNEDNPDWSKKRYNVLTWPSFSKPKSLRPKVLLTSHIDVVPPYLPYNVSDKGKDITRQTTISGRGTVDAKASVAAQITAVQSLLSSHSIAPEDVALLFVVGEEAGGDGMRFFSHQWNEVDKRPPFKAVIFGEPTVNQLACGHKGALLCRVTAKGKAGHSGYPWLGKSANEILMRGLVKVLDTDLGSSEEWGNTTVNVGTIRGGVARNVIPEEAVAEVMVRVAQGPESTGANKVEERMEKVLKSVDEDLGLRCIVGTGAVPCDCDVEGFETIHVVGYGTDVPNLKGNHKRYLYGPGSILVAHGKDEALTVGELEDSVEAYKRLVLHALKA